MFLVVIQICIYSFIVHAFSFDDISNEITGEMIEDGKNQYQLLQERGKLPRYGECWTSAVEHIHEGCRYLTEDVQSDIALRITNCFLEMSGHETYNCDVDKKPNLRGICINSMSDRAFNVYTEFYTHAQNICWFLRGQVWQEKISERTFQVGEQLKNSVTQQETLLRQQKESLEMQQQLLSYGRSLEKLLNHSRMQAENIMEEIKASTAQHHKLLVLMTSSLSGLQNWLIGEISWFDSLVFYISGAVIIVVITSTARTNAARLPLLFTLSMNIILERIICDKLNLSDSQIHIAHQNLYKYIWFCRHFTIIVCILIILAQVYYYQDYTTINNTLLQKIQEQNCSIKEELQKMKSKCCDDKLNLVDASLCRQSVETEVIKPVVKYYKNSDSHSETSKNSSTSFMDSSESKFYNRISRRTSLSASRDAFDSSICDRFIHSSKDNLINTSSSLSRYNLRSRPETPSIS